MLHIESREPHPPGLERTSPFMVSQSHRCGMEEPTTKTELQVALQSLSTCQRCQQFRKKCDSRLPACRLCERADVECISYDHALEEGVPRKYIHSVLARLDHLKMVQAAVFLSTGSEAQPEGSNPPSPTSGPPATATAVSQALSPAGAALSFDNLVTVPTATVSTSRFYGSSSVFSLTIEVLARASRSLLYTPLPMVAVSAAVDPLPEGLDGLHSQRANDLFRDMVHSLLTLYTTSIGIIYTFLDDSTLADDLEVYFQMRDRPDFSATKLEGAMAYRYFRITMMCAIACSSKSRHQPHWLTYSRAFYSEAVQIVEAVTSEVSSRSLEALLFIAVYCLFSPRKGNVWKILDFACRLSVQLGYHTEEHSKVEDERQKTLRRSTFWTLYSIERLLGQFLGRPSDLPEAIISTEYPTMAAVPPMANDTTLQSFAAGHLFRLTYLRSEIYTSIYLPVNPQPHNFEWFVDRYSALLYWYQEVQPFKDMTGCGTVTCNVLYHSSVIFLFQPLLLRALSSPPNASPDSPELDPIPSQSYHSARELIRIYNEIVRAPETSELGSYPMTFLSAYSIWLAAMALMAHCLLTIDGRVETLALFSEDPHLPLSRRVQKLDYSDVFGVSGTCLILLAWCAEKWPGMEGMMDAYQRLSQTVLPILMQRGHF